LLRHADLALYEAKARGGNMMRFFLPEMKDRQQYLYWVQQDLRRAIVEDELTLHYQPKIRLIDHQVSGFEALLRWNHPQRGAVSPTEFIPAAENCHLIVELGQLVLRKTCAQVVQWQREGLDPPPVAINLSAAQFVRQDVAAMVLRTLDETGLSPELLELEVTESILLGRSDNVRDTLSALRALGIGITLDDFGTGYSSLSYLQRFPINKIKIDKTFVQSIAKGQSDLAIVRAIIAMAHSLEITVVAEGVESEAQCRTLANLACDEVQGFYIGHAEPPEHSSRWLHLNAAHTLVGLRPLAAVGHG
jgi:EAL domain-containing protein (putative c-di-GMP-specific phosphodiesterase class I)